MRDFAESKPLVQADARLVGRVDAGDNRMKLPMLGRFDQGG
jgi:hypothetical protein